MTRLCLAILVLAHCAIGCAPAYVPRARAVRAGPCVTTSQRPPGAIFVRHEPDGLAAFTIAIGERLCLVADAADGTFTEWHTVPTSASPTLDVSLESTGEGAMFEIHNGTASPVKYRAALQVRGHDRPVRTSVCPVVHTSFEEWPDDVSGVFAWDMHALRADESGACER